jgi:hypothetical protein
LAQCPFCSAEVPVRLVVDGGTCPSCFGEIPGEESPTDPGEAVKEQLRQEDQRRARRRAMLPVFVAAPVAMVSLLVAGWYLQPVEVKPLEIPDLAIELDLQGYEAPQQVAQQGKPPPKAKTPTRPDGGPSVPDARLDPSGGATPSPTPQGVQTAGYQPDGRRVIAPPPTPGAEAPQGLAQPGGEGGAPSGSVGLGDVTAKLERSGAILTEESDISRAVKDMVAARKPRLVQCYEQSLKADESLAGQWNVSFTLGTNGQVKGVQVKGVQRSAPAFEACIRDQVATWSIRGQLEKERSLNIPLKFTGE